MQWTSSVSSRPASVRLRAVRTRIGLPDWSSRSGTIGEPAGSSSISSTVRFVGAALSARTPGAGVRSVPVPVPVPELVPVLVSVLVSVGFSRFSVGFSRVFSRRVAAFSAWCVPGGACSLEGPLSGDAAGA